jgi:hypothetical protein
VQNPASRAKFTVSGDGKAIVSQKIGPLTTPQVSRHATDRIVASHYKASDTGLRPGPFPDRAASLLPGLLAAIRTGLSPAGEDELASTKIHHGTTSRCHSLFCRTHENQGQVGR